MKKHAVRLPMSFMSYLTYIYCKDSNEIQGVADGLKAVIPGNKADGANGLFIKSGTNFYVVFHANSTFGEIGHEVIHFMNTWYDVMNQKLDTLNDEAYCHMYGHYLDEAIKFKQKCEKES